MVSLNFGKESSLFPVVGVKPGRAELALLNQVKEVILEIWLTNDQ